MCPLITKDLKITLPLHVGTKALLYPTKKRLMKGSSGVFVALFC
jgi:hypothetical protein